MKIEMFNLASRRQRAHLIRLLNDYFLELRQSGAEDAVPPKHVPNIVDQIAQMIPKGTF